jgi:hypothetical protein
MERPEFRIERHFNSICGFSGITGLFASHFVLFVGTLVPGLVVGCRIVGGQNVDSRIAYESFATNFILENLF